MLELKIDRKKSDRLLEMSEWKSVLTPKNLILENI